ncbi:DNA mismatch repair protein MutS [Methanimicrococcus sp. At1]|uniref:DNA mismatch repair protein MutS n=1 Tax=Methanimicrococcus hacksteinii TaxID=3028293 RepID=A0ABU3VPV1_9EURY|nr:DNA mismatch repair protein MutS [Methanimicrococcus sp. At1]MDV0445438.1 DNA mismatch repair protein MutS [Methanimicrococcus sp. At1]
MSQATPAMKQYYAAKEECPDALVFFRMGDFYESFGDDAKTIARELEITLTNRGKTEDGKQMPLAGIPYHAIDNYLPRLVKKGYKVAICEQLEDPKKAKGIVKRGIVRVVTPGTAIDSSIITDAANNYLMALAGSFNPDSDKKKSKANDNGEVFGISFLDISTGEFFGTQFEDSAPYEKVISEVARYKPSECIIQETLAQNELLMKRLAENKVKIESFSCSKSVSAEVEKCESDLLKQFKISTLEGLGFSGVDYAVLACGKTLDYALKTQMRELDHIQPVQFYSMSKNLILDSMTLRNLEIIKNTRDDGENYSLIRVLDKTKTPPGSRLLRNWLLRPLVDPAEITERLNAVSALKENSLSRYDLRQHLSNISDIERLVSRMIYGNSNARDLISMRNSLFELPGLCAELSQLCGSKANPKTNQKADSKANQKTDSKANQKADSKTNSRTESALLSEICDEISQFDFTAELSDLISKTIVDEPPITVREGRMIQPGYSAELDELRNASGDSKEWIAAFQTQERERTGIKNLKVGYNKVFGYFIEVTNANKHLVPENYIRKQTVANGERYFTPELKERESLILTADDKSVALEYEIFREVTEHVSSYAKEIQAMAHLIGKIDVLCSFAEAAIENNYVCPQLDDSLDILIRDGRHPIVEKTTEEAFVPNDTEMDPVENQFLLITGPNMAGKSTYMRQIAMIIVMAQAGSFVPASHAKIGVVDRIFTRIGAHDDLAGGKSTFMVEMVELANILNNSGERNLILLDEIGRGTSTYDGYSIAKAVVEYIHNKDKKGVRTLFATHYHQLTALENKLKRLKNFHIAVRETGNDLVFLRKIVPGATDKSYGIHVARLAGVPEKVNERAAEILKEIENESLAEDESRGKKRTARYTQLLLFDPENAGAEERIVEKFVEHPEIEELKSEFKDLDVNHMTPMQALLKLEEVKEKLRRLEKE